MTNLIIASFSEEAQAMNTAKKLTELEAIGDITIYESVMIRKDEKGEVTVLEQDTAEGSRTLTGMAIGGLIGVLGGPVGMMAGMLVGTITGAAWESDHYSFSRDFAGKVADELQPGMVAIIAEVDEDNKVFLDTYVNDAWGKLVRTDVEYEYDKISNEQLEAIDEEIAADRNALRLASQEEKEKIQQTITTLKEKRKEKIAAFKAAADTTLAEEKGLVKETRAEFIHNRIARYREKLAALEEELKNMTK
ncbi:DUF1269 domain-containing protein [Chitinophaga arvensicola]|uniref:Uncharacterized membrane protein n=1 Tax=Chitinophaga arvensicola TaxID=29529 RepID=A0A1I0QBQ0_9BACT|nr:DUF1269 domain-containing protein [Chitinophaga arvensicola]SEW24338.1 Uncharacterized membrane protein [Chitinophaga arvensicola]